MINFKPYTCLEKVNASGIYYSRRINDSYETIKEEDEEKGILYLGITVAIPDGYVLFLSPPRPGGEDIQSCSIRLVLYKASAHRNISPVDYLIGFDLSEEKWANLKYIEVFVGFLENSSHNIKGLANPWRNFSDQEYKVVGYSREDIAYAGLLFGEAGIPRPPKEEIVTRGVKGPTHTYGPEDTLEKLMKKANIRNAVGTGIPPTGDGPE